MQLKPGMKRSGVRGVTLVELMVVVVLVVMLLALAMPSATAWMRNTQIRNVATAIQNGLQRARIEAMRRNANVRFSLVSLTNLAVMDNSCALSATAASWVVSLDSPATKCGVGVDDATTPRIIDLKAAGGGSSQATVAATDSSGAAASAVVFDGFGRVVNGSGIATIDVQSSLTGSDYRALRIVIGPGGNTRMCEPAVTATGDPRAC